MDRFNTLLIGLLAGIIFPIIFIFVFYFFSNNSLSLIKYFEHLIKYEYMSHIVGLSAVSNLVLFSVLNKKDLLNAARGVVFATMLYVILVVILKFT